MELMEYRQGPVWYIS